jgi:periplasmic divalent cation tolerance protein
MDPLVVYVTTETEEQAVDIAKAVVGERLAACANIIRNVRSIYRWEGEVQDDQECLMVVKTTAANFPKLKERVVELHSYECPEVVALPITDGHRPYLDWLDESTK